MPVVGGVLSLADWPCLVVLAGPSLSDPPRHGSAPIYSSNRLPPPVTESSGDEMMFSFISNDDITKKPSLIVLISDDCAVTRLA